MRHFLVLMVTALVSGCTGTLPPAPLAGSLLRDAEFGPPAAVTSAQEVFALNAAMRSYLRSSGMGALPPDRIQHGLVDALYAKRELKLEYDAERTRTAAEAFDARAGNCLSLVIMTAAFARELGLPVRYQVVESPEVWDRNGNLVFSIGHVNVSLGQRFPASRTGGPWGDWLTVDFMSVAGRAPARTWPVDEQRVVAMYLNNRAAETLASGNPAEAYWWARAATLADASFPNAFNTLGVIYQRHGGLDAAEAALREALRLQPDNLSALGNLVGVVTALGRGDEAEQLSARLHRLQPHTPFMYLGLGLQALHDGDYAQARDLLRKELPQVNGHHEVHFGLALAYAGLGDRRAAANHLKLARENSLTRQQQGLYAAKLTSLEKGAATP